MKKNYLMAVCLFLTVMSGCGNKEQAPQQAEPVKVDLGSRVRQGIAACWRSSKIAAWFSRRLSSGTSALDEVSMQNTYQAAKAALKQAEDAYQRMKELHEKGSLAEMKWVEVQSKLQQAQSMEAVARKNLTDCQLYAPFSGVIAEKSL